MAWIDMDRIYVGTDCGMSPSGRPPRVYPRIVKEWQRGTPLADAATVYEGKPDDVLAEGHNDPLTRPEHGVDLVRLDP